MKAIGLDVHQKATAIAILDTDTGEFRSHRLHTSSVVEFLCGLDGEISVVLETGSLSTVLARKLRTLGVPVTVVDAFKAHRVCEAINTAKTDRLDACALARLAAQGPEALGVWVADEITDELRALSRTHRALTQIGTRLRNEIRAMIRHEGQLCPYSNLVGKRAQQWLHQFAATLPPGKREALLALLAHLLDNVAQLHRLHSQMLAVAADNEMVRRLKTICGCGIILAVTIAAEIGHILRFVDGSHLRGYSGLVPEIRQSGERQTTGPLRRRGNPFLRHALILLAQHVGRSKDLAGTRLKATYYRHLHKWGPNPAKVALARKLCDIIYAMLRDGIDFDPERLAA